MKSLKTVLSHIVFAAMLFVAHPGVAYGQSENIVPEHAQTLSGLVDSLTFMIASDLGRNGYYDQKPVAEMMGLVASIAEPEFVAALGDIHHFLGVRSVHDPLWNTNFEWIYKHPELMIPWHPIMGNHEYEGNTQAVLDYSTISRRWEMPERYYSMTRTLTGNVEVLILYIDTPSLIDKYRNDSLRYNDAGMQPIDQQLVWIDSTLRFSDAKWKIIMGHHPIYAGTLKDISERVDLQSRLQPLLDKYEVDISIGGHIHNFQHIRVPNSDVDYFVNSSASLTREVIDFEGALFGSSDAGFSLCTAKDSELILTFVNKEGEIIYQYTKTK